MKNKTPETILRLLSCYAFISILLYFITAFATWKLNPANWHTDARFACALVIVLLGSVLFAASSKADENDIY